MTKSAPIYIAGTVLVGIFAYASPSRGGDESTGKGKPDGCETIARRKYDLCMAGPKADREACLREYDATYLRCKNPPEPTPPPSGVNPELSQGVYRFPYADGSKVHVGRGFHDHNPPGKLDMAGRGGGTYRIVAAAAGTIRFIQDSRSKQQHPERWLRNTDDCNNNYVWIEHDNGEWSKYSHMQQYSTTRKAGRKVGDRVREGDYLGDEGKVGCAWPAHLHFEVVRPPSSKQPTIGDPSGELSGYGRSWARNPVVRGVSGKTLKDGETYLVHPPPKCKEDGDCDDGFWCNRGVDLSRNECLPLKDDNETCDLVGGGHQCKSGKCRFSRCYTPGAVSLGGTCYNDDACKSGKCSDIDGVKGMCVCNSDSDCGNGNYCDEGLDLKINRCHGKLDKGEKCGKAGSFGNDHKCKSGKCSGFPKYECK